MKICLGLFTLLVLISCRRNLTHERFVSNLSSDTILLLNPDYSDTIFIIPPSQQAMIYSYEILDTKQESEPCLWMGDTLYIEKTNGLSTNKRVTAETNWTSTITGNKERLQKCTFTLTDDDF